MKTENNQPDVVMVALVRSKIARLLALQEARAKEAARKIKAA